MTIGYEDDRGGRALGGSIEAGHNHIETECMGQIGMRDDHPIEAGFAEFGDTLGDRSVQSPARFPDDSRPDCDRPVGDLLVVADHVHGSGGRCGHDCTSHGSCELDALRWAECSCETTLGNTECLDGDEDCDALTLTGHEAECRGAGR